MKDEDMDLNEAFAIIKQRIIDLEIMNGALEKDNKNLKNTILEMVVERNSKIQKFEYDAWNEGYEAGIYDTRRGKNLHRANPYEQQNKGTGK